MPARPSSRRACESDSETTGPMPESHSTPIPVAKSTTTRQAAEAAIPWRNTTEQSVNRASNRAT